MVTKGLECLLVESLTAARRHGLDHAVLDSLVGLFGPQSRAVFDFLIRTHAVHAQHIANTLRRRRRRTGAGRRRERTASRRHRRRRRPLRPPPRHPAETPA
ncbi:hypothetical protein [Azospirillum agricola]|uniref:hypothetical protein n=1 Tax=Azospirillum agricola TaxID=1720247 RepID=UPI0015C440FB|nr:hypothetical protein [Azospirillum agricola]